MEKEKWNNTMYDRFKESLYSMADEKYKDFHRKLVPEGLGEIIGVRSPDIKKTAKDIVKNTDYESFLQIAGYGTYEETMVQGFVIGYSKADIITRLGYLKDFIPHISNWAVCDGTAAAFKVKPHEMETVFEFIKPYTESRMEYEQRLAAVFLMDYFITGQYIDSVLQIYGGIKSGRYYVNMAVAWGISVCFVKFPEITMEFLKNNELDNFTYNKALQKIIESNRVDAEVKNIIRGMKRK